MAFTRVRGPGITTDDNYRVGVITATKFVGPIETTTDSDFTNISVSGIGTIDGVKIGDPAGIVTSTTPAGIVTYYGDASKLTGLTAGQIPNLNGAKIATGTVVAARIDNLAASKITSGTVATARLGSGTANNGVFLRGDQSWQAVPPGTTINSNTNNYLITGTGTANTLQGESNLTFDGNQLSVTTGNSANPLFVNSTYGNTKLIVRETTNGNTNAGIQIQKRHSSLHPANHWYGDISFLGWDGSGYHRAALIECVAEGTPANDNMPGNLIFSTNPGQASQVEALRISKTGLVGINQSTPTERLHVVGNAIVTGMIMAGDGTTSNCAYANNGDNNTGMYFPAADNVSLSTGGTQRFLIESNGIVKIGNSVGNYYSNDLVLKCAGNAGGITIASNGTSDANFINFADATSSPGYLAGGIKYRHDTDAFIIRAGHEEKVEVQTSGNLKINDGDLVIGTSGHGIDFSATADGAGGGMWNEKLSDYETGTFTPVTYGWGTATPYSGSSYNSGWYVRVGAIVHVGWKIYYNGLSGSNSHIGVGGFPFNSAGNHGSIAAARFDVPETAVTYDLIFYMGSSDNKVWLYQKNSSGGISAINSSGNRSNCWTFGQVTYYVT